MSSCFNLPVVYRALWVKTNVRLDKELAANFLITVHRACHHINIFCFRLSMETSERRKK